MQSRKSGKILQQHQNARENKIAKRLSGRLSQMNNDDELEAGLNNINNDNSDTNIDNVHEDVYQSNGDDVNEYAYVHENDLNFYEEYKVKYEENSFVNDDLPYFELSEADGCEPILDDYASDEDVGTSEGKVKPSS